MKIKNIKIAKILSFGPVQEIKDLSFFNLFIGKNGSGKTNIFNLLSGKYISFSKATNSDNVFTAHLYYNKSNEQSSLSIDKAKLEINYENNVGIEKQILFCENQKIDLIRGDVTELQKFAKLLIPSKTDTELYKELRTLNENTDGRLPLLSFALSYIFNAYISIQKEGSFIEFKTKPPSCGTVTTEYQSFSSGMFKCLKIIVQYFSPVVLENGENVGTSIILIDEPELNLEPRAIRRLFEFIVWLSLKNIETKNEYEEKIFDNVENKFSELKREHPSLIRPERENEDFSFLNPKNSRKQVFIASHSPIFINEFLKLDNSASVYEFDRKYQNYKTKKTLNPNDTSTTISNALFSTVRKISNDNGVYQILDNLGCKGSDLLQTNGVVWVEGPSDVIYIEKWLKMFAFENDEKEYLSGRDFEFQMFGGTLLDSLCLIKSDNEEKEEYKKLVSMFSFSRNAFVVIDSDAVENADGGMRDKSKFHDAKQYIKKKFEEFSRSDMNLGLWYKEDDVNIRTMESYLDEDSKSIIKKSWTKKITAQKVTESWGDTKELGNFPNDLEKEIKVLYETISEWNK